MMENKEKYSKIHILLFALFTLWTLLQFFAPMALPHSSVADLSGLVGVSDNEKQIKEMPFPWSTVYSVGDRLCHQKADRSFFINGNQMPFCSRCTAIWLGIAVGLGFMFFYRVDINGKFLLILIAGLIPIVIDGIGQFFGFWESSNVVRVITGLLAGITVGIAMVLISYELEDIDIIKKRKKEDRI